MAGVETDQIEWQSFLSLILSIFVVGLFILIPSVSQNLVNLAIYITGSSAIKTLLWVIPIVISFLHYVKVGAVNEDRIILIKELGPFANTILTGVTYGQLLGTSYSIIGKAFLQHYLGKEYFIGFSLWGLSIIVMLVGYLAYWSFMKIYRMCLDMLIIDDVGRVVTDE